MRLLGLIFTIFNLAVAHTAYAAPVYDQHVGVELVSYQTALKPGETAWLGVRMTHEDKWHTYWQNPGDSGYSMRTQWDVPAGFSVSHIAWPLPERISTPPLMSYGYSGEVLFPVAVKVPEYAEDGRYVTLRGKLSWLMCRDICLPGEANVELTLPIRAAGGAPGRYAQEFAETLARVPQPHSEKAFVKFTDETVDVYTKVSSNVEEIDFFPLAEGVVNDSAAQISYVADDVVVVKVARDEALKLQPNPFPAVLEITENGVVRALEITAATTDANAPDPGFNFFMLFDMAFWLALISAFIGGLILNLMPCVLPVLSLKVLHIVKHSNQGRKIWQHGLLYLGGVLFTFWVLAGIIIALKSGGEQVGWGFQLQSPLFVMAMGLVLLVVALDLFGVFEIGASLTRLSNIERNPTGATGSVLTGALAAIVATPCTAPFMGAALAFTLSQNTFVTLAVFTMLGVGLASPYLLLTFFPRLTAWLPKPGRWMETFRQVLGFPVLATVLWLLWILGTQTGADGVVAMLIALLGTSFALWLYGRIAQHRQGASYAVYTIVATVVLLASVCWGIQCVSHAMPTATSLVTSGQMAEREPFNPERIAELRAEGKPVFVIFTANWCITCKVNERLVLSTPEAEAIFADNDITVMVADWTLRNDDITQELARHGRNGIPFYLLYPAGLERDAIALSELITLADIQAAVSQL